MKCKFVHIAVSIAVGSLVLACGGSSDSNAKTSPDAGTGKGSGGAGGGQSSTSGGSTNAGGSGTTGAGGGAITGCTLAPCDGQRALGVDFRSCCIDATTCGITAGQRTTTCGPLSSIAGLPREAPEAGLFTLPEGGLFGPPETIVLDTSCPDTTAMGTTAKGCCDKSGFCGSAITQINQCFTVADLTKLAGGALMFDAGPQKPCTYKAP